MEIDAADFREFIALNKITMARPQVLEKRVFALTRMLLSMGAALPPGWNDQSEIDQAMAALSATQKRREVLRGSTSIIPFTRKR